MNLIIITPCSRPENLLSMRASLSKIPCEWVICYDTRNGHQPQRFAHSNWIYEIKEPGGVSGNAQRNAILDFLVCERMQGWVYCLDDDNLMHPDFYKVWEAYRGMNNIRGMIFGQELPDGGFRINTPDNIKVCHIDQAQYCLHTDLIGSKRYIQKYEADGHFIEELYRENPGSFVILPQIASYYNRLKWNKP
ncbi:MAG TPA: hypothetical protein P5531_03875 [Bacteroidales bacterium]|nr:hypothetical protein [Bacteroidales bacterium]